jgi:hypothetical protein
MNQNYDKAKLLHRLWNEENARRTAFGLKLLTMQEFIQQNQATEDELTKGELNKKRVRYSHRRDKPLTMQERRLMANAFRGAVTGIQRGGSFAPDYWNLSVNDKEIQNIADEGTTLIKNAQQYGQGVIESDAFQAFTVKTSELSNTVIGGITDGIQQVYSQLKDTIGPVDTEKIFKQMSQATGAAKQGLEGVLTYGDASGINNTFKTNITAENAKVISRISSFIWKNLPSWEDIVKVASTIWEAMKIITSEVPEEDLLDVKLKF